MDRASHLIERARRHRIRKIDLARAMGLERTTVWKYEQSPAAAPEGFWGRYETAIGRVLAEREAALAGEQLIGAA